MGEHARRLPYATDDRAAWRVARALIDYAESIREPAEPTPYQAGQLAGLTEALEQAFPQRCGYFDWRAALDHARAVDAACRAWADEQRAAGRWKG